MGERALTGIESHGRTSADGRIAAGRSYHQSSRRHIRSSACGLRSAGDTNRVHHTSPRGNSQLSTTNNNKLTTLIYVRRSKK